MSAKKIIIIGFLVAVLELLVGVWYLQGRKAISPLKQTDSKITREEKKIETPPSSAKISLVSDKTSLKTGETLSVSANLSISGKGSSASDLTIKYDPAYLSLTAASNSPYQLGDVYQKMVFNQADLKAGIATMSAISDVNKEFLGSGTLAKINFKALKKGPTNVRVEFTEGETRDSNVVVDGKDILKEVSDLTLQID